MKREPKIDNTSTTPSPSMEWKPLPETLDELKALPGNTYIIFAFGQYDYPQILDAEDAHVSRRMVGATHWMPFPSKPTPTPTIADLERAVVEAVDAMKRHGVYAKWSLEDVLITRHDAILAHRERAKNNSGDAAGV